MNMLSINAPRQINSAVLLAVILIEGYITISVEVLTIRQLLPVAGSNVVVTSLIIGIFLLFLAYGYRQGGTYSSNHLNTLSKNFLKSAVWVGIGLCYFFINSFFYLFETLLHQPLLVTLIAYLLLITAPIVYFLGQTVPLICYFYETNHTAALLSSKVLYLSTLGSFLGSIGTTLIFMNYIGVGWTVFINFILLMLLFLTVATKQKIPDIILLACATIIAYMLNVGVEAKIFALTDSYANYQIYNDFPLESGNKGKLLIINNSASSFSNENKKGFSYIEAIKKILFQDLKLHNKNILVLGAGGFSLSAENTYKNHFTYVDIDKKILPLVKKQFSKVINGSFVAEDARVYVKKTQKLYDVIVSDAYNNKVVIPPHLLTREYLLNISKILSDSGYAVFNIAANPTLEDTYSKNVDATIRSVFSACMVIPEQYINALRNIIYVCKKTNPDGKVYTDNLNSATLDAFRELNA